MKIVILNYENGDIYEKIEDATDVQVAAYSNCDIIIIEENEFMVNTIAVNHADQALMIFVDEEEAEEEMPPTS
jgi:hypothetical protein